MCYSDTPLNTVTHGTGILCCECSLSWWLPLHKITSFQWWFPITLPFIVYNSPSTCFHSSGLLPASLCLSTLFSHPSTVLPQHRLIQPMHFNTEMIVNGLNCNSWFGFHDPWDATVWVHPAPFHYDLAHENTRVVPRVGPPFLSALPVDWSSGNMFSSMLVSYWTGPCKVSYQCKHVSHH